MELIGLYADISPMPHIWKYVLHRRSTSGNPREILELYVETKKISFIKSMLKALAAEREGFYEKLCEIDGEWCQNNARRHHRYFSKQRQELIVDDQYIHHHDGYWMNGNPGTNGFKDLLLEACEAASIKFSGLNTIEMGHHFL